MTPEEHVKEATLWVLKAVKIGASLNHGVSFMTSYKNPFEDLLESLPPAPHPMMRRKILLLLQSMDVIKMHMDSADNYVMVGLPNDFVHPATGEVCVIAIQSEKFNKVYKEYSGESNPLHFDSDTGILSFADKEFAVPYKKIEYYLIKRLFEEPFGTRFEENEMENYIDRLKLETKGKDRRIYDAHIRLNKKVHNKLGIKQLIHFKGSHYWINPAPPK